MRQMQGGAGRGTKAAYLQEQAETEERLFGKGMPDMASLHVPAGRLGLRDKRGKFQREAPSSVVRKALVARDMRTKKGPGVMLRQNSATGTRQYLARGDDGRPTWKDLPAGNRFAKADEFTIVRPKRNNVRIVDTSAWDAEGSPKPRPARTRPAPSASPAKSPLDPQWKPPAAPRSVPAPKPKPKGNLVATGRVGATSQVVAPARPAPTPEAPKKSRIPKGAKAKWAGAGALLAVGAAGGAAAARPRRPRTPDYGMYGPMMKRDQAVEVRIRERRKSKREWRKSPRPSFGANPGPEREAWREEYKDLLALGKENSKHTARRLRTFEDDLRSGKRVVKREPLKTNMSERDAKRVVARYKMAGELPKTLTREQKMGAYEARYVASGGRKGEKWQRRADVSDKVKNAGLGVATAGGAAWLATRGKSKLKVSPKMQSRAENVAAAGAVAGGAGELYGNYSRRKRSSYSSAPGGVAASALRRMRDMDAARS